MWRYTQRRLTQLGQAPALDGVQVKYRTGSVKHSSAVLAHRILCRRRRHVKMRVLRKLRFTYTNIPYYSVKTARNVGESSSSRSEQQLANSINCIMSWHSDAVATT